MAVAHLVWDEIDKKKGLLPPLARRSCASHCHPSNLALTSQQPHFPHFLYLHFFIKPLPSSLEFLLHCTTPYYAVDPPLTGSMLLFDHLFASLIFSRHHTFHYRNHSHYILNNHNPKYPTQNNHTNSHTRPATTGAISAFTKQLPSPQHTLHHPCLSSQNSSPAGLWTKPLSQKKSALLSCALAMMMI